MPGMGDLLAGGIGGESERVDGGGEGCVIGDVEFVGGVEVDEDEEKRCVGLSEGADVW